MNIASIADPAGEIARAWVSHLWLTAPAFAVTIAALAVRVGVVRRALRSFSEKNEGLWLDGRTSLQGTLERVEPVAGDDAPSEWVFMGRASVSKQHSRPAVPSVELAVPVCLRLADGTEVEIAAGTGVTFSLFDERVLKVDEATAKKDRQNEYERGILVREGSPVWMVAHLVEHQTNAGPMRSSQRRSVASGQLVEMRSTAPTPPEGSFDGAYALVWCALLGSGWIATADGWAGAAMVLEGLWAVLALVSLRRSMRYSKALRARGA